MSVRPSTLQVVIAAIWIALLAQATRVEVAQRSAQPPHRLHAPQPAHGTAITVAGR